MLLITIKMELFHQKEGKYIIPLVDIEMVFHYKVIIIKLVNGHIGMKMVKKKKNVVINIVCLRALFLNIMVHILSGIKMEINRVK